MFNGAKSLFRILFNDKCSQSTQFFARNIPNKLRYPTMPHAASGDLPSLIYDPTKWVKSRNSKAILRKSTPLTWFQFFDIPNFWSFRRVPDPVFLYVTLSEIYYLVDLLYFWDRVVVMTDAAMKR